MSPNDTLQYPKRLIEVDLPIARISAYARGEKSIRQGHISSLHIWWARRPLAACRAVICAALWPDPADVICPQKFRDDAFRILSDLQTKVEQGMISADRRAAEEAVSRMTFAKEPNAHLELRKSLLDFIAEFANWDLSTNSLFLEASHSLTQSAHESLGGEPGTHPLVVDPFAGGGAIPLEALRVGADAFASDLNPIPVLLNKVVLEYIPKYGQRLADEVCKWGDWIKKEAEKELADFYPKDPDGATPIAYLWARTSRCEGPECGAVVPMVNQMWIKKKGVPTYAFEFHVVRSTEIEIQIVENPPLNSISSGTTKQGSVTCPCCGFTTKAERVREQGRQKKLGMVLMGVVLSIKESKSRRFRTPTQNDFDAINSVSEKISSIENETNFSKNLRVNVPLTELRRISVPLYGLDTFDKLFLPRQRLAFCVLEKLLRCVHESQQSNSIDPEFRKAVVTILSLVISNTLHYNLNLSTYLSNGMVSAFIQGTSLAMRSDFAEANPIMKNLVGGIDYSLSQIHKMIEKQSVGSGQIGSANCFSAKSLGLPDDGASLVVTDPPYYDSIPYSHLSDIFYIWLRSSLGSYYDNLFVIDLTNKEEEIVEDRAHSKSPSKKGADFYERELMEAFAEIRRVLRKDQLMVLVFAHKSTRGWESMLNGLLAARWTIVGSWPIDTERPERMNAHQNASLLSSVHVACRPLQSDLVGDWRDILSELPRRIHEWMPRLASEGVVGADAIFACLGPALEVFSRYSRVEKASGEQVTLKEYLEHVWAAVSNEALSMIFKDADASGLEPDARLTAMWLWTLGAAKPGSTETTEPDGEDPADSDDDDGEKAPKGKVTGFSLEYDAARKIAQGLGIHLEKAPSVVEVKGDQARLLPVGERTRYLFGKEAIDPTQAPKRRKKQEKQLDMFAALEMADAAEDLERPDLKAPTPGDSALDRVHQAMILFGAGRAEALKRFLVEDGVGKDPRFWKLAQSLSALYPGHIEEKRWVDGVLARKKSFGY